MFRLAAQVDLWPEHLPVERILFGSDTPMDDRSGQTFIPNTLASIDQIGLPDEARAAVLAGNAERLFARWLP